MEGRSTILNRRQLRAPFKPRTPQCNSAALFSFPIYFTHTLSPLFPILGNPLMSLFRFFFARASSSSVPAYNFQKDPWIKLFFSRIYVEKEVSTSPNVAEGCHFPRQGERNIPNSAVFGRNREMSTTRRRMGFTRGRKGCVKFGGGPKKTFFSGKEEVMRMEGPHPPSDSEKERPKSAHNSTEKSRMLPGILLRDFTSSLAPKNSRILPHGAPFSLSLPLPPHGKRNNGACATMGEGGCGGHWPKTGRRQPVERGGYFLPRWLPML